MYKNLLILFVTILFVYNCTEREKESIQRVYYGPTLKKLIEEALWGSIEANHKLSGLVNSNTPSPDEFNQIVIDSTIANNTKKLYSVLLENPNPLHNLLAVYDDSLNLLILDNSLNGNIICKWDSLSNQLYLTASENFISKDILKLSRLSLYTMISNKFYLVFRSFTRLDKAGKIYQQSVIQTSHDNIATRIKSFDSQLKNGTDNFVFIPDDKKYKSSKNIFDEFVIHEINEANWLIEKPELKIETITQKETETDIEVPLHNEEALVEVKGFQLSLNSDWNKPINIAVTDHFISKLEGIRYINQKLGAQITVIKLPERSNVSQFIRYKFGKPTRGNYRVRSTELIESGNNYIQFFEHSCGNKNYILLLQTPKHTYNKNKRFLDDIITSFFIEC